MSRAAFKALNRAVMVVGDEDLGLFFVWYGGAQVSIYDEDFNEVDLVSMSAGFQRKLTPRHVRAVIDRHRQQMRHGDD